MDQYLHFDSHHSTSTTSGMQHHQESVNGPKDKDSMTNKGFYTGVIIQDAQ